MNKYYIDILFISIFNERLLLLSKNKALLRSQGFVMGACVGSTNDRDPVRRNYRNSDDELNCNE